METRAQEKMRAFCKAQAQENLDAPVVTYLTNLLMDVLRGEEDIDTLTEVMNSYFTRPVSTDFDVRPLLESLRADVAVTSERRVTSELNVHAASYTPQGEEVPEEMVAALEAFLLDPASNPVQVLSNLFPSVEIPELMKVFNAHQQDFVSTLNEMTALHKHTTSSLGGIQSDSSGGPKSVDWRGEAFPELPGQRTDGPRAATSAKTSFLDIAKKKKPPADKTIAAQSPPNRHRPPNKKLLNGNATIPWVNTGEAVSKQYSELRAAASEYAKLRNSCFDEATKAYRSGNKALAKELGRKGRMYSDEMKRCHHEASEAIFRNRNLELKSMMQANSPEVLDLHGLHVTEAKRILTRELNDRKSKKPRDKRKVVHLLVGTGHHTKGTRTPSRLPSAVQDFLLAEGYVCRRARPGVIDVEL